MSVINTNISSMQAQSSVRTSGLNLATAMERLSSGVRINSAKDDAAGLAISTRMTASIRGISAAIRNANDGISLTQTAEGSLAQIGDNLQRIRELAVQSANTGNNASDRAAMNNEAKQLIAEIDRVASNTKYNGIALLDGSFRGQDLQVGAGNGANDRIAISIGSAKSSTLGVGGNSSYAASKVGSSVGATALADSALNINGYSTSAAISDGVSSTLAATSGIAVAAAINAISAKSNVTATVGETSVVGTAATGFATAIAAGDVKINGVSIGPIAAASTAGGRGNQVAAAVNAVSSSTGVTATFDSTTGAVSLNAADGRNITIDAVNAGGRTAVTGLGLGTTSTMAAASAAGNTAAISNLKINGVAIADVGGISVTTTPGAAAVTVAATTAGVAGPSANQVDTATFINLAKGQSVSFAGLTFTAAADITADKVATAFKSVGNTGGAITAAAAQTKWVTFAGLQNPTLVPASIGSFTSGTSLIGTFADTGGNTQAKFTATAQSNTQLVMAPAGTAAIAAPVLTGAVAGVANTTSEQATATFIGLAKGQSVSFAGLTFTAAAAITAEQVATAFKSVGTTTAAVAYDTSDTGAQALWLGHNGNSDKSAIGSFTSGTSLIGTFASGPLSTDAKFTVTAQAAGTTITSAGTDVIAAPVVAATTPGKLATAQVSTATFTDLEAGASVTFAGLTFTSGTGGTSAAQLQAAFASIAGTSTGTGLNLTKTAAEANANAGTNVVSDTIGRFTSGTTITGGTFAASGADQVTWTALTASNDQTPLASAGSKESYVFTFSALKTGQSATINNLTFTAKKDLTSAEVASAFGSLESSTSTTPANTPNGDYTGSWMVGYSTAAASGATVTAKATAAGTADIAFSSSKFTDLVSSINAKTAETGVTATLASAGKVSLVSTKDIVLSGAAATSAEITALTGISGTAVASTAANTSTMRSAVTLSSTNAAGINLSGTTAAALAASGLTEESVVAKTTAGAGISSLDLTTGSGSQAALTTLDSAINTITDSRAAMGAYQNRLTASISNLETTSMNLSASRSRILDTDYAKETTNLAKSQIIQQAATAMLAQANQSGQSVLALLK